MSRHLGCPPSLPSKLGKSSWRVCCGKSFATRAACSQDIFMIFCSVLCMHIYRAQAGFWFLCLLGRNCGRPLLHLTAAGLADCKKCKSQIKALLKCWRCGVCPLSKCCAAVAWHAGAPEKGGVNLEGVCMVARESLQWLGPCQLA